MSFILAPIFYELNSPLNVLKCILNQSKHYASIMFKNTSSAFINKEFLCMVIKDFDTYCNLYGYDVVETSMLKNIMNPKKFEKLHINVYSKKQYTLLLKTDVKNAEICSDDNRLIVKSGGKNKSTIMNILKKDIDECIYKRYDVDRYEIVFSLGDIFYRVFVLLKA